MTNLYLPNKHLDSDGAAFPLPVIKQEIQNWLNKHTPGWMTDQLGGILWVTFSNDHHMALAKHTWHWND